MKATWLIRTGILCGCVGLLYLAAAFCAEPDASEAKDDKSHCVPVATARDRAKLMYDIYAATLDTMHERYFHGDRAIVPAHAMEDIFAEIKRQSKVEARWISVNMKPMSINHEPKTEFEKRAAKEIASGKAEVDIVEDGYYRRVGAIPLGDGCISCHGGLFQQPSKSPKFAGLIISVPVKQDSSQSE
ncbi:hypothetical protein ETAA8_22950 [Anatilimnocola aggregata]|uniref:Tll0287-like domain-containing protein n=1 Tax=Anatilimnocola aggregata TaxID=2528021 RepID=A0A517YAF0_9BACT|nr:DUF3365 domain-containing protein [Anatilimnocola aggregata]QDU27210.1 hypothetical protein ETAA8_22950 [Anatilimnocola aggregata]